MSLERLETALYGTCPVCAAVVTAAAGVVETEVLPCPQCRTMLVVDGVESRRLALSEAPKIEEDWGE